MNLTVGGLGVLFTDAKETLSTRGHLSGQVYTPDQAIELAMDLIGAANEAKKMARRTRAQEGQREAQQSVLARP